MENAKRSNVSMVLSLPVAVHAEIKKLAVINNSTNPKVVKDLVLKGLMVEKLNTK